MTLSSSSTYALKIEKNIDQDVIFVVKNLNNTPNSLVGFQLQVSDTDFATFFMYSMNWFDPYLQGAFYISNENPIYIGDDYQTRFIYFAKKATTTEAGKIGINTFNPAYTLDVSGDINYTGTLTSNGSNVLSTKQDKITFDDWFIYNQYTKNLSFNYFGKFNLEQFYLTRDFGILLANGTTGWYRNSYSASDTRTSLLRLFTYVNVGIKNETPAYELDVLGDINYTGTLRKDGVDILAGTQNNLTFSNPLVKTANNITLNYDNTTIGLDANNKLKVINPSWTSSGTSIYNTNSGNVGINTNSPYNIFQIGEGGRLTISNGIDDNTIIGTKDLND